MIQSFFLRQYDFEIEQKRSLDSGINIPVAVLTILGGAFTTLITRYEYEQNISTTIFVFLLFLGGIGILKGIAYLPYSYLGFEYEKVAPATQLKNYYNELVDWHKSNGVDEETAIENSDADFQEHLAESLAKASEHNSQLNMLRGERMYEANKAIFIAFVLLAIATPFYFVQQINNADEIQKIQVVSPIPNQ